MRIFIYVFIFLLFKLWAGHVMAADLPETETYDTGVYQIETTDPVIGGVDGISNKSARNLANRTKYLKAKVDLLDSTNRSLTRYIISGTGTQRVAGTLYTNDTAEDIRVYLSLTGALSTVALDGNIIFRYNGSSATSPFTFDVRPGSTYVVTGGIDYWSEFGIPPPPPDTIAPTVPTNLSATVISTTQIDLAADISTDSSGVNGYKFYMDGAQIADVASPSYSKTGLTSGTTYSFTVAAYDIYSNLSAQSVPVIATTTLLGDVTVTDVTYNQTTHIFTMVAKNVGSANITFTSGIQIRFLVDDVVRYTNVVGVGFTLNAGASEPLQSDNLYTIPDGVHVITADVNANQAVVEANYLNNSKSINVSVTPSGAQGFAQSAGVTGGAGGQSIVVTNTNASGAGSLRAAIETSGPKIITFTPALSGTITFASDVHSPTNDWTLDGTGASITIAGYSLNLNHNTTDPLTIYGRNIIIRRLTFNGTQADHNAINIDYGTRNVWIDHNTFVNNSTGQTGQGLAIWDRDYPELHGIGALQGITVSWNKFSTPNIKSLLIAGQNDSIDLDTRISLHHNWFNGVNARNPRIGNALVHMWNNYINDWTEYGTGISSGGDLLSENNIYEKAAGGTAIDANYGGIAANSVNISGNWYIGTPAPTAESGGTFPNNLINYTYTPETADAALKTAIMAGAGA